MKNVAGSERPALSDSMNPIVQDVISRCWQADPAQRYSFDGISSFVFGIEFRITAAVGSTKFLTILHRFKREEEQNLLNGSKVFGQ
jgi:hypothetical protein